jgi:plastocyanin
LSKTSAVALCGYGLAYLVEYLVAIIVVGLNWVALLPVLIFTLAAWITAGLILFRVRSALIAGAVVALVTLALYLVVPATRSGLLHPTDSPLHFGLLVVTFAFALVAIVTGIAATVQYSRGRSLSSPRWLRLLLDSVAGLVIGMTVITFLIGANPQSSSMDTTTNGMPTVHTVGGNFQTNVVLVPKGGSLVITNDDGVEHIIQNGSWTASGTSDPQAEAGAPVVQHLDLKAGSITIGPFTTAGVFHLYCPIHRGMNLTVVVQ